MKRRALFFSLISVYLAANGAAFGQKVCEFNIVGTWKAAISDEAHPVLYRFAPDGTVTARSLSGSGQNSKLQEIASATYQLDNPRAPKAITFTATKAGGGFAQGATSMKVIKYDDASFTCENAGSGAISWIRVDPHRYFLVLAGRSRTFYDNSGPAFPMLIKMDGQQTQIDAVGIYSIRGKRMFGPIPAETYQDFMKDPRAASDVMLRLEITPAQYERGLKILRTWERRAQEGVLLYPDVSLDNILLVKQVTEILDQCGEKIKLYKLDWGYEDKISDNNPPPHIPFLFFKEMRRLNESLHVRDEKFHEYGRPK